MRPPAISAARKFRPPVMDCPYSVGRIFGGESPHFNSRQSEKQMSNGYTARAERRGQNCVKMEKCSKKLCDVYQKIELFQNLPFTCLIFF